MRTVSFEDDEGVLETISQNMPVTYSTVNYAFSIIESEADVRASKGNCSKNADGRVKSNYCLCDHWHLAHVRYIGTVAAHRCASLREDGLPAAPNLFDLDGKVFSLQRDVSENMAAELWHFFIEDFSNRKLTLQRDRSPAFLVSYQRYRQPLEVSSTPDFGNVIF